MKKQLCTLALFSAVLFGTATAQANSFTFNYGGYHWGTMYVDQVDANTLSIRYDATTTIPDGSQATGFGFAPDLGGFTISNPAAGDFVWDQDSLNWTVLTNLNAIPNPANSSYTKDDFVFGATEGNANNYSPPGIAKGDSDIFYLDFTNNVLESDITLVGVRLQGLPGNINGGSLFLVGEPRTPDNPVPEPGAMLLLGTGVTGIAGIVRRKKK